MYKTGSGSVLTYQKMDDLNNIFPVVILIASSDQSFCLLYKITLEILPCQIFQDSKVSTTLAALQTDSELGSEQTFAAAAGAVQNEDDLLNHVSVKLLLFGEKDFSNQLRNVYNCKNV